MELRAAGTSERGEIRRLLAQSGLPVADLEDSAIEFLVAIADGALVGTVGIERHGDVGLLRSLTVAPAQRGSGLGSRLVGALEAHAAASGVNELVLLTTTARDFFERRGYLEIAIMRLMDIILTLPSLLRATKEVGLAGLEKLTGIPAQVGGAVAMNAGTRDGETFDHLVSLTLVEPEGRLDVRGKDRFRAVYRDGGLRDAVVLQASFELVPDDPKAIFERFSQSLKRRNATQPVSQRSVGCVFRNPAGDAAGRLIEAAGCKTLRAGGIEVSGQHANYFVNDGRGSAADFVGLMAEVKKRVHDRFGVDLEPEVKFWGF